MGLAEDQLLLAGDIGATKTLLGLYRVAGFPDSLVHLHRYVNRDFPDLESIIATFLATTGQYPCTCCLGVAGPVFSNRVRMTNLPWSIDGDRLRKRFGFRRVRVINDMEATAAGALLLKSGDLHTLNAGRTTPRGTLGILALGTGLGEAYVVRAQDPELILASEGGHGSFAPTNQEQIDLLTWLLPTEKHVSVEKVCSGQGVGRLYAFQRSRQAALSRSASFPPPSADQTPAIVQAALDNGKDPESLMARAALRMLLDILAAEAANVALKLLTTGGIFIGGGLMARLLPLVERDRFLQYFCRGVYSPLLGVIPVQIITNSRTALLGAAAMAHRQLAATRP